MNADVLPATIADTLRREIVATLIAPGEVLTEAAVAARFGCSRPTARTAIDRLVTIGVLVRGAHRAARVVRLDRDDILDLYDARAVLESAAVAELARSGAVPPASVAANRRLRTSGDEMQSAEDDVAFHRALGAGQPNGRLRLLHRTLMDEAELCIGQVHAHHLMSPSIIAEEHQQILEAILDGSPDRASARIREHIAHSREQILSRYDEAEGAA